MTNLNAWYTIAQMVEVLDISDGHFRRNVLPKVQGLTNPVVAKKDVDAGGRGHTPWIFYPRGVLEVYFGELYKSRSEAESGHTKKVGEGKKDESEIAQTKALIEKEKLRKLKRENELADRTAIPRDEIHDAFVIIAQKIRKGTEQLQKRFGPKAHKLIDDQIAEALESIEELCDEHQLNDHDLSLEVETTQMEFDDSQPEVETESSEPSTS